MLNHGSRGQVAGRRHEVFIFQDVAMSREERLIQYFQKAFSPTVLEVHNESYLHRVPPNSETHFKVLIVSNTFEGLSRAARHRAVFALTKDEQQNGLHALSLELKTPKEWENQCGMEKISSPPCQHKKDVS